MTGRRVAAGYRTEPARSNRFATPISPVSSRSAGWAVPATVTPAIRPSRPRAGAGVASGV